MAKKKKHIDPGVEDKMDEWGRLPDHKDYGKEPKSPEAAKKPRRKKK